jgi:hypothetical protein
VFRTEEPRVFTSIADRERGPLAKELYDFRMWTGMKRSVLARKMIVSGQVLFNWESGVNEPTPSLWAHFVRIRRNYRQKLRRQEDATTFPRQ